MDLLAAHHIPDPHGALVVARDQPAPIGTEGHAGDVFGFVVADKRADCPVATSQIFTVPSSPAEASRSPSGLYATA